jgi:hypothetical protein
MLLGKCEGLNSQRYQQPKAVGQTFMPGRFWRLGGPVGRSRDEPMMEKTERKGESTHGVVGLVDTGRIAI